MIKNVEEVLQATNISMTRQNKTGDEDEDDK
jgi:hypothetical protein